MLPTSHFEPINELFAACQGDDRDRLAPKFKLDGQRKRVNLPVEGLETQEAKATVLAGECSEFILAALRLEKSYQKLQRQVSELGSELSERNLALNQSVAENERMRVAVQQMVDSMPCGVLVLDRDSEISMLNPESGRLLWLAPADFGAASHATLQRIITVSGINLESVCSDAIGGPIEQEYCVCDLASKRWLEVRHKQLFLEPRRCGKPDQTILSLRDVTSQKRSEQEREAGRKSMALAESTAILAHEIRNPLASLELFAELIENDGDRRGEWISHLRAGIRSLSGTVNNVLTFHGIGALKLAPIQLSVTISNAIDFVKPITNQASISLEFTADDREAQVMGNQGALEQVVLNLISNAIRHTPEGGTVTVAQLLRRRSLVGEGQQTDKEYAVVEFSDTGSGIRPDQLQHLFEPGFSGSGDTSGLGLAVCAQIMKQHGGEITATNRIPSGAVFALHFLAIEHEAVKG